MKYKYQKTSVFKGAIFTVGLRWSDRVIGFVSTIILARLLTPDDFGVVAIAMLVILLADVFLNLGVNVALIQNQEATQEHYDTAWTLRILQTILSCAVVTISAPLAADYFNDPRVVLVIQLTSLHLLINGFENIGIINFQKEMLFVEDFRFRIFKRFFGFIVTMVVAWYLRSYWALVLGTLAGSSFGTFLSYVMHPMRPRICLSKVKEIFQVSQWMLVNSIGKYFHNNLHKIFIGRGFDSRIMGEYSLADEIAKMPAEEVLAPLNRVLFPAFSAVKHDLYKLKRFFLLAQGIQALIAIPASVGLMLVSHEAVFVLLGEKWLSVARILEILVLANIVQAITVSGSYVVITLGYFRSASLVTWIQVLVFLILFLICDAREPVDIAIFRTCSIFFGLIFLLLLVLKSIPGLKIIEIIKSVVRPLVATSVMYLVVINFFCNFSYNPVVMLVSKIIIGVFVYAITLFILWFVSGKPEGSEYYILKKILRK